MKKSICLVLILAILSCFPVVTLAADHSSGTGVKGDIVQINEFQPMSTTIKTKSDYVTVGSQTIKINVTANITTNYSEYHDRQLISSAYVTNISSATSGYEFVESWLEEDIIDGRRTFHVVAQGYVWHDDYGFWTGVTVSVYFYCSATGAIS